VSTQRKQLSTLGYSQEARDRLADAVNKARLAAGYRWRTNLAKAAGVSVRSVTALERAEPGVGQANLYAIARVLPGWTEDTMKLVLDGGDPPAIDSGGRVEILLLDDSERQLWALDMPDDVKWGWIYQYRALRSQSQTGQ
jgi:hypothetical protein